MIALDTNVLVRYLVEDDPRQAAAAAGFISRTVARGEPLFIPQIVLCELVWVLSFAYEFGRDEIATALRQIRRGAQIVIEAPDQVREAIEAYARGKGDFADYLIAERAMAEGCTKVFTFDRALHSDSRFEAP
ncbi:MAG: PIN domain-containing protein [Thermoanaerobaculia bacterium]